MSAPDRDRRRVFLLAAAAVLAFALAWAWLRHAGRPPAPEERAREKAVELREKTRELTR